MRLDPSPMYRKVIIPWYDSETVCVFMIGCMFFVFLFSLAGVSVAYENPDYHEHIWVPVLLILLSSCIIISTSIRIARQYFYQFKKEK
ncbi:MAG: hypothetical protein BWK80_53320 [Desulfobacteraceae bacterium IS3]|nr:MAG: hypothetical protein BWK80_53320 [Desulfobacteraceae bacterium IS3]